MTGQELTKLWELYPEARNLYEQYNGILETVRQLEYLAKRRKAG